MSDKVVTLAVFSNLMEAHVVRNRLEAEGIPAQLTGESTGGLLPGMEAAFAHIQILVMESDLKQACEILGMDLEEEEEECEVPEDEDSDAIKAKERRKERRWAKEKDLPPRSGIREPTDSEKQLPRSIEAEDLTEPEWGEDEDELEEKVKRGFKLTPDDLVNRALMAAVLGLVLCPPIGQIYSAWLILRMAFISEEMSPQGIRKLYLAIAINLLVFVGILIVILVRFYRYY